MNVFSPSWLMPRLEMNVEYIIIGGRCDSEALELARGYFESDWRKSGERISDYCVYSLHFISVTKEGTYTLFRPLCSCTGKTIGTFGGTNRRHSVHPHEFCLCRPWVILFLRACAKEKIPWYWTRRKRRVSCTVSSSKWISGRNVFWRIPIEIWIYTDIDFGRIVNSSLRFQNPLAIVRWGSFFTGFRMDCSLSLKWL